MPLGAGRPMQAIFRFTAMQSAGPGAEFKLAPQGPAQSQARTHHSSRSRVPFRRFSGVSQLRLDLKKPSLLWDRGRPPKGTTPCSTGPSALPPAAPDTDDHRRNLSLDRPYTPDSNTPFGAVAKVQYLHACEPWCVRQAQQTDLLLRQSCKDGWRIFSWSDCRVVVPSRRARSAATA